MITPLDIENKKFSKQMMHGYSVEEVEDFLDDLAIDYARNYKELAEANTKIDELQNSISHYKNIETTLQNTLVMAQTTAEEVKNIARQQAEQILNEAQIQADEILRGAKENSRKTFEDLSYQIQLEEKQLEDVKKQFDIYKAKMESLLISQLELIKEINRNEN